MGCQEAVNSEVVVLVDAKVLHIFFWGGVDGNCGGQPVVRRERLGAMVIYILY